MKNLVFYYRVEPQQAGRWQRHHLQVQPGRVLHGRGRNPCPVRPAHASPQRAVHRRGGLPGLRRAGGRCRGRYPPGLCPGQRRQPGYPRRQPRRPGLAHGRGGRQGHASHRRPARPGDRHRCPAPGHTDRDGERAGGAAAARHLPKLPGVRGPGRSDRLLRRTCRLLRAAGQALLPPEHDGATARPPGLRVHHAATGV